MQTKACSKCQRTKAVTEYRRDSSNANGIRSACRECCSEIDRSARSRRRGGHRRGDSGIGDSIPCPEIPIYVDDEPTGRVVTGLDESGLELELGPAGIAPVTPEEAHKAAPEGYAVKGVSTLYDSTGAVVQQWVKTDVERAKMLQAFEDAVKRIAEPATGLADPVPPPEHASEDLLCVAPVGDSHFGMHAWGVETGDDFDLEIAERNMAAAFDRLIALAPSAGALLLIDLGDLVHSDDPSNRTAKSGHALDVDTRWSKVIEVVIRIWRRCIDRALTKFSRVISWNVGGNHDPNSAVVLRQVFKAIYEREPRVSVDLTPGKFLWHRFGETIIGSTHGDTVKLPDLPGIMACDRPQDWGETKFRHWYTGHVHHDQTKEFRGCIVETFRTLAPKDAWHASQGYRSGRDIKLDVFHRRWGRINRHVVGIEQIVAEAA